MYQFMQEATEVRLHHNMNWEGKGISFLKRHALLHCDDTPVTATS